MKKIATWKVIALSLITFGIYTIVWFALRRNELVEKYDQKLPHWLWLVIPMAAATGLYPIFIIPTVILSKDPAPALLVLTTGSIFIFLVPFIIGAWWTGRFGMAVAKLTKKRVPTAWTVLLYIFCGPVVVAGIHQYYFNRYPTKTMPTGKSNAGPTRRFVILSIVALLLGVAMDVYSLVSFPAQYEATKQDMIRMDREAAKDEHLWQQSEKLLADYQKCTAKLEADFPEVTDENETAYNKAYDACEEIRVKQWKAADEYNNSK